MMQLAVRSISEDRAARRWSGRRFGIRNTAWSTVVGVDIGLVRDSIAGHSLSRDRITALGITCSDPVGLEAQILVRSPLDEGGPSYFARDGVRREIVVDKWRARTVRKIIDQRLSTLRPRALSDVTTELQTLFWVDDPDSDMFIDNSPTGQ